MLEFLGWLGVVAFQAVVYFTLKVRRDFFGSDDVDDENKLKLPTTVASSSVDPSPLLEDTKDIEADIEDTLSASRKDVDFGTADPTTVVTFPDVDDVVLDGDEPENFLELVSQTGSEMIDCRRSLVIC